MKKLSKLLTMVVAMSLMIVTMIFTVSADEATDLSKMKVYGVDASGNKTEVPMSFSSTTYEYELTVKSDVVSIEIEADVKDSTSKWEVEKVGINTKMDTGMNKTVVVVTSSAGAVQKYTLNTKKLTTVEEATYQEPETDGNSTEKSAKDTSVKVGNKKFKISTSFSKSSIPEGFKKSTAEYKGKKYTCIKGEVKDITAFYLYRSNKEGFYIYDSEQDKFYAMNNIKIKSRMYTIVQPKETDGIVEAYKQKKITIIDQKVKAWMLDEEEGMYLVYAMNWNGDVNLYSYDDNEKCFQRYLTSSDANRQSEAAAKAYNKLQKDYNKLVDKYNVLIKILCGLVILIIILIFVIINLALNKKEKKIKNDGKYSEDNSDEGDTELTKAEKKAAKKEAKQAKKEEKKKQKYEQDEDDIDSGIAIDEGQYSEGSEEFLAQSVKALEEVEEVVEVDLEEDTTENKKDDEVPPEATEEEVTEKEATEKEATEEESGENETDEENIEKAPKKRFFERKPKVTTYGDVPTFGTDRESEEGFYGGEIEEEDEIFIDIINDDSEVIQEETVEEDIKETIKSLLPDDQDEDDDDDDFEFIDLN